MMIPEDIKIVEVERYFMRVNKDGSVTVLRHPYVFFQMTKLDRFSTSDQITLWDAKDACFI